MIDLATRMVVGWQTADDMRTSLVVDALSMAVRDGYVSGGAVFHSDHGSHYTSTEFAECATGVNVKTVLAELVNAGITPLRNRGSRH